MITLRDLVNSGRFVVDTTRSATLPSDSADQLCKLYNTCWGAATYTHMSMDSNIDPADESLTPYYITGSWLDRADFVNDLLCKDRWGNVYFKDIASYHSLGDLLSTLGFVARPSTINGQTALRIYKKTEANETLRSFANFYFIGDSRIPHPFRELEFKAGSIKRILESSETANGLCAGLNGASKYADISNYYWTQIDLPSGKRVWGGYGGNQPVWLTEDGECPTVPVANLPSPTAPEISPAPEGSPYKMPAELEGLLARNGIESGTVCMYFGKGTCKILRERDKKCLCELECRGYKDKTAEQWSDLICQALKKIDSEEE